jgi:type I restriction enzyme S subunit
MDMKQGWEIKAFDDCIEKVKVTIKLPSSSYKENGIYPIVSQEKELISGYWDNVNDVVCSDIPVIIFGDHTMVVKYVDFDFVVGADGVKILKPKTFLIPKYFYYWVMSVNIPSRGYARHYRYLREKSVLIPSMKEQQRIVEILDREFEKIDALKANAERSLQQAKDLFQSALKQELQPKEGWETKRLSDICVITSSKRIFKSEYVAEGIPFYRTKEVKEIANNLPISVELYISNEKYSEIKNKFGVPQINDLLVSAVGTIGEIMVVTDDKPFYFKDGNLVWLKGIQGVHSWYLKYYLKSIIDDIKNMTRGAAYNALTIEKFQTMDICFSSMAEQKQIVMRLDKLSTLCKALEENYTKTMALCDDMKQALLRQAFNGEL